MDTLDAMRVFTAVAERSGFSAAADALDRSTAASPARLPRLNSGSAPACSTAPPAGSA